MKVFIDCMVFLHYRDIEEIDLPRFLGNPDVTLIVPRITFLELDKHKNSHSLSRIRRRAKRVLKKIERWTTEGVEIRPNMSAEFYPTSPAIDDYTHYGLNPAWNDDILIASMLKYKENNPGEDLAFVTQDSGPKLIATHLGIKVFQLPEEYKLPEEPDPKERENKELKKVLSRLQNSLPELVVRFAGSNENYARFVLPPPPESKELEISRILEELRETLPKQYPPKLARFVKGVPDISNLFYGIPPISPEEYDRYNKEVDKFLTDYEHYLRQKEEIKALAMRTIQFRIEIHNLGTAPADDADVEFYFPDGFQLAEKDNLPAQPKEPSPPPKPMTALQIQMYKAIRPEISISQPIRFNLANKFSITRTNSYTVTDHFERIKHGNYVILPELSLTFDTYESAASFNCDYKIRPANLPDPILGKLNFVIEKISR